MALILVLHLLASGSSSVPDGSDPGTQLAGKCGLTRNEQYVNQTQVIREGGWRPWTQGIDYKQILFGLWQHQPCQQDRYTRLSGEMWSHL